MKNPALKGIISDGWRMVLATILMALGLVIFTIPNNLVPGGISGLSTALAEVVPLKVGTINLLLSILVEAFGWWYFGFHFIMKATIISTALSLLINGLEGILPGYMNNPLVAAIAAGVLFGLGASLLLSRGISSGGSDTISLIVKRYFPHISVGKVLMGIDAVIVLFGTIIFRDIDVAIYSGFTIFVSGKVVDSILTGMDYAKLLYIITDRPDTVVEQMLNQLGVGVTMLSGKGGYTKEHKDVLMTVVKKGNFTAAVRIVKSVDAAAFVIVQDATEVLGEGFKE